jgi:hypothetical protein
LETAAAFEAAVEFEAAVGFETVAGFEAVAEPGCAEGLSTSTVGWPLATRTSVIGPGWSDPVNETENVCPAATMVARPCAT